MQWEYKILLRLFRYANPRKYQEEITSQEDELQQLGVQGWELVAAVPIIGDNRMGLGGIKGGGNIAIQYVLKRPRP